MKNPELINAIKKDISNISNELLKKPGVVSVGIGFKKTGGKKTDQISVICSVEVKKPKEALKEKDMVPKEIKGFATDVVESGVIKAFGVLDNIRPALGGDSIGHYAITAGTLGCAVHKNGQKMILSNNHVMANSNEAQVGDMILKPGVYDGGTAADKIAVLEQWEKINFIGDNLPDTDCPIAKSLANFLNILSFIFGRKSRLRAYSLETSTNLIDAALAKPLVDDDIENKIREIGKISNIDYLELGMNVRKFGRTTGYTEGEVEQVNVTTQVSYGTNKIAVFSDQVIITTDGTSYDHFSQPGDSGSAVLCGNKLVGLLFAGSDTVTIVNRIENVFNIFGCSL